MPVVCSRTGGICVKFNLFVCDIGYPRPILGNRSTTLRNGFWYCHKLLEGCLRVIYLGQFYLCGAWKFVMKIVTVLFCGVISFYSLCTFYFKSKIRFQFQRKAKSGYRHTGFVFWSLCTTNTVFLQWTLFLIKSAYHRYP